MLKLKSFLRSGNCKCGRRLRVLTVKNEVFYFCPRRHWFNFWMHEKFNQIIRAKK
jgi:hypothetical protein